MKWDGKIASDYCGGLWYAGNMPDWTGGIEGGIVFKNCLYFFSLVLFLGVYCCDLCR